MVRRLYARDHLDQVLATFGLILFFNELVRVIWGPAGKSIAVPAFLSRTVQILPGVPYPAYRFALIVVGAVVALLLAWLVARTQARHADPRRRLEPAHDRGARRQHRAAVQPGVRAGRGVRRPRRPDGGARSPR